MCKEKSIARGDEYIAAIEVGNDEKETISYVERRSLYYCSLLRRKAGQLRLAGRRYEDGWVVDPCSSSTIVSED